MFGIPLQLYETAIFYRCDDSAIIRTIYCRSGDNPLYHSIIPHIIHIIVS